MKLFALLLSLLCLHLLLFQCESKKVDVKKKVITDTVVVRDTVITIDKQVFINASKMNVFYIGVDNPIDLELTGLNPNDLNVKISGAGGTIKRQGGTKYAVTVTKPGEAIINISGGGINKIFSYRVKRIPDPVARLSNSSGGDIGNGEFKAQGGLVAFLENFDFDVRCQIQGFQLTRIAKRADPIESVNPGARFNDKSRRLISQAKPGDVYTFSNVKVRCPGDPAGRRINSLVFNIK